jgi:hypothetical protein
LSWELAFVVDAAEIITHSAAGSQKHDVADILALHAEAFAEVEAADFRIFGEFARLAFAQDKPSAMMYVRSVTPRVSRTLWSVMSMPMPRSRR